jgi:aspartyl-tRNA(Asn)/glutamyl-tRNA(Gln) amidotransferase subunit C
MLAFAMPAFSRDDVARIAALANLELEPAETDLFARQLGEILAYANELQQIDTTGVTPTTSVAPGDTDDAGDRVDEVRPSLDRAAALANAPDPATGAGLFRVPRVIG